MPLDSHLSSSPSRSSEAHLHRVKKEVNTYLRNSLIINPNQLPRLRINLQRLVKAQCRINRIAPILAHALSPRNLLHKISLRLVWVLGKSLIVGFFHYAPDLVFLRGFGFFGLDFCFARDGFVLFFQVLAEVDISTSAVIKVEGVGNEASGYGGGCGDEEGGGLDAGGGGCGGHVVCASDWLDVPRICRRF
jgi:hypothetical protein